MKKRNDGFYDDESRKLFRRRRDGSYKPHTGVGEESQFDTHKVSSKSKTSGKSSSTSGHGNYEHDSHRYTSPSGPNGYIYDDHSYSSSTGLQGPSQAGSSQSSSSHEQGGSYASQPEPSSTFNTGYQQSSRGGNYLSAEDYGKSYT